MSNDKILYVSIDRMAPSVNHIWKHSNLGGRVRTYLTKEGREFKDMVSAAVPKDHKIFTESVCVDITFNFPDNRRRDIDNYCKGVLDGLNHRAFKDDSQIQELVLRKTIIRNKPSIQIMIQEVVGDKYGDS